MAQKSIFIPYFTLDFMIARIADSLFLAQLSLASGECELHSQASGLQKPHYGARMQGEPAGGVLVPSTGDPVSPYWREHPLVPK
jgi:hypothetical protein